MIKLVDLLLENKVYKPKPLNEVYSEGLIKKMVDLYKTQTTESEDQIRANIKRFEQLTGSIAKKLADNNPLVMRVLPDDLKKPNNVRDITKYDYDTLVKVLKAADTKSTDPYKQAIEFYKKQNHLVDPAIIGNYVARFKQNVNTLKQKIDDHDDEAIELVPKELLKKDAYKDILNWRSFEGLEHMLDSLFPIESKGVEGEADNDATTDADKIYDKDGLEIYQGDEEHKCIRYGKGYPWCIGRTMYANYRYQQSRGNNRMFYFIFDRNLPKTDKYHAVVLHAFEDGGYTRTTAKNGDESSPMTWDKMGKDLFMKDKQGGPEVWNRIRGLEKLFKFKNPNRDELRRMGFKNKRLTLDAFIDLDHEDKKDWMRANATDRSIVTPEIVKSLPAFGEGVSKNDLINYGREFSMEELQPTTGLIKRYADYSFTHRKERALPPSFIPYFKEDIKEKYFKQFEKSFLRFDLIEKYFGSDITKQYVQEQLKDLGYLPKDATKWIEDPKQKQLFELYSKLFTNWDLSSSGGDTDEKDIEASNQTICPILLSQEQWKKMSPNDQKNLVDLIKKLNGKSEKDGKYEAVLLGAPFIIENNGKDFLVLPKSKDNENEFVITDTQGNIQDKTIYNDMDLGSENISNPFVVSKVFKIKDVKANGKNLIIKENYYDNWDKYSLQRRAGIIK